MIVEGQVHGGLADGVGMALMQVIGVRRGRTWRWTFFTTYLLPTSL